MPQPELFQQLGTAEGISLRSSRDGNQTPLIVLLLGSRISPLLPPSPPRGSVKSPSLDQMRKETQTQKGTPERAV